MVGVVTKMIYPYIVTQNDKLGMTKLISSRIFEHNGNRQPQKVKLEAPSDRHKKFQGTQCCEKT